VGYKRNSTTLFAVLNMLDGTVIGERMPRRCHREFLRFLDTIDERNIPQSRPASHCQQLCRISVSRSRESNVLTLNIAPVRVNSPTSAPRLLPSGLAQATQRWLAAFKSKKGVVDEFYSGSHTIQILAKVGYPIAGDIRSA
jgi:hypothetical protein